MQVVSLLDSVNLTGACKKWKGEIGISIACIRTDYLENKTFIDNGNLRCCDLEIPWKCRTL